MKSHIILGIDETANIENLLNEGVRQFYFGFLDDEFYETYNSQTSLNRRYYKKEQFTSYDKAYSMIESIHKKGGIVYLALNGFTCNDIFMPYVKKQYEAFSKKIDGIIVANITLAQFLKENNYKNIVLSNLFGLYSVEAVRFFKKMFAPKKFILPRDISLEDIEKIVTSFKDDEFECFLFGDNCRFSESFCFSEHGFKNESLCQFAFSKSIPIKSANANFKHILKHNKLTQDEKVEELSKKYISLHHLLDELEVCLYEKRIGSEALASPESLEVQSLGGAEAPLPRGVPPVLKILRLICEYDVKYLKSDKKTFVRLVRVLKTLEYEKAKEILKKLNGKYEEKNMYEVFHKTNPQAIKQTLGFFAKHKNITSYKVPSRGRDFMSVLNSIGSEAFSQRVQGTRASPRSSIYRDFGGAEAPLPKGYEYSKSQYEL